MLPYNEPVWSRIIKVAGGYRAIFCPSHPNAWPNGYVYMHRLVLERKLGRLLTQDEIAHHDNEDKADNHPDNIILSTRSAHTVLHMSTGTTMADLTCNYCGNKFQRAKRRTYKDKPVYCNHSCAATRNRLNQIAAGHSNLRRYRLNGHGSSFLN